MAEFQLLDCPECGVLHEVDPSVTGERVQCSCGAWIDVPVPDDLEPNAFNDSDEGEAPAGGAGSDASGSGGRGASAAGGAGGACSTPSRAAAAGAALFVSVSAGARRRWKLVSAVAGPVVLALVLAAFWRGPELLFGGAGSGTDGAEHAQATKPDPSEYLEILADNDRAEAHPRAAAALLQIRDLGTVPRLCELAADDGLVARPFVLRILGYLGDDRAVPVLDQVVAGDGGADGLVAAAALCEIGSPQAESVLRRHLKDARRARKLLPAIATVDNLTASKLVGASLRRSSLRSLSFKTIVESDLEGCVDDLAALATDRDVPSADRLRAVEVLGRLGTPEAHRALGQMLEDGQVGWKARQVFESLHTF